MAYTSAVVASSAIGSASVNIAAPASALFDGITVTNGQRVLLTQQSTASQNGVWIFNGTGTAMTRPTGTDQYASGNVLDNATCILVAGGSTLGATVWGLDPAAKVTVDTTSHTLTRVALPPVQVRAASTSNLASLSSVTSLDGVSLVGNGLAGSNVVLLKDQTTGSANGLYWANTTGAMVRTSEPLVPSRTVLVSEGAVNAQTQWGLVTAAPITVGTTSLSWALYKPASTWKDWARAATTGTNITLSGTQTIDGVALAVGDRVLVKDQTTGSQNGIYLVASGTWQRAVDAGSAAVTTPELSVRISEGALNAHSEWYLTNQAPITLGTTALTFAPTAPNTQQYTTLGALAQGQAFRAASGKATAATVSLTTVPFVGIATGAMVGGVSASAFQTAGIVSPNILNLGAGVACAVGVNSSGIPVRATDPTCASPLNWIGFCDISGTINLQPTQRDAYCPTDYGCPWDGVNDDLPGMTALQNSIPAANSTLAVIRLPKGMGYFSDNFRVQRTAHWEGNGGGDNRFASGIRFAPGKGFFIDNIATANSGSYATGDFTRFRNMSIQSYQMQPGTVLGFAQGYAGIQVYRQASTAVFLGYVVQPTVSNGYCIFRCTTPGTTSSTAGDPALFSTTTPGTTIPDGTVVWTAEGYASDYQVNHVYQVGQKVRIPGDCRYNYRCVYAGTSAAAINSALFATPAYFGETTATPSIPLAFADGPDTLQWQAEAHNAFTNMAASVGYENLFVQGFQNCTIEFLSTTGFTPQAQCDFSAVDHVETQFCGMGVYLTGFDSNAIIVRRLITYWLGLGRTVLNATVGAGGHSIWDHSLKNRFEYCYSQNGAGPAYRSDGDSQAVWVGMGSENGYKDLYQASSQLVIEPSGGGTTPGGALAILGSGASCFGLASQNATATTQTYGMGFGYSGLSSVANGHIDQSTQYYQLIGDEYQMNRAGVGGYIAAAAGTGWWARGVVHYQDRIMTGESQYPAVEGFGHVRDYFGRFGGYGSAPYYLGVENFAIRDPAIRSGQRIVGDRFKVQNGGAAGGWDEIVCVTAGYVGAPWLANAATQILTTTSVYAGSQATMVEPTANIVGTQVPGQSGAAAAVSYSPQGVGTVTGLTGMTPASVGHILSLSGTTYAGSYGSFVITQYISATSVKIVAPYGVNPESGLTWRESLPAGFVFSGANPNFTNAYATFALPPVGKKVFRCTTTGTRGATEPNWSTATMVGNTVTDGTVVWMLIGFTPEWALCSKAESRYAQTTPQSIQIWADALGTDGPTSAPKGTQARRRFDATTTTNTANQTIATIDLATLFAPPVAGALPDNSVYKVKCEWTAKTPAGATEAGGSEIIGHFYRSGGALTRVGADTTVQSTYVAGSTGRLSINAGNWLDVQVSPGVNSTVGWEVIATVTRKAD